MKKKQSNVKVTTHMNESVIMTRDPILHLSASARQSSLAGSMQAHHYGHNYPLGSANLNQCLGGVAEEDEETCSSYSCEKSLLEHQQQQQQHQRSHRTPETSHRSSCSSRSRCCPKEHQHAAHGHRQEKRGLNKSVLSGVVFKYDLVSKQPFPYMMPSSALSTVPSINMIENEKEELEKDEVTATTNLQLHHRQNTLYTSSLSLATREAVLTSSNNNNNNNNNKLLTKKSSQQFLSVYDECEQRRKSQSENNLCVSSRRVSFACSELASSQEDTESGSQCATTQKSQYKMNNSRFSICENNAVILAVNSSMEDEPNCPIASPDEYSLVTNNSLLPTREPSEEAPAAAMMLDCSNNKPFVKKSANNMNIELISTRMQKPSFHKHSLQPTRNKSAAHGQLLDTSSLLPIVRRSLLDLYQKSQEKMEIRQEFEK